MTRLLPEGVAAPSVWLAANGYSRQLVRKYVLSGWLKSLSHGAYAHPGQGVGWEGVLLGLQRLAACRSIKVKRIFLFLANHFSYPWAKRLETANVDLGRGNRQIVKGGRLDKQFLITVPENFGAEQL